MKKIITLIFITLSISIFISTLISAQVIVFYENNFPSIDNGKINRAALEQALAPLKPRFMGLDELMKQGISDYASLLVLPYGSAFPVQAWESIRRYLDKGNLLVIGGNPLTIPVEYKKGKFIIHRKQNTYSQSIGIFHYYSLPKENNLVLQWDENSPTFRTNEIITKKIFVNAGYWTRCRGLAYFINNQGDRVSAPVIADDIVNLSSPARRRVYLSFEADTKYWESKNGIQLIRESAVYAQQGGVRLWLDIQQLTIEPGGTITGSIDVVRKGKWAKLTLELIKDSKILSSRTTICGNYLYEEIGLSIPLHESGLYQLRASLSIGDTIFEQYSSGVVVRDTGLLCSGQCLSAGKDYFRLDNKPYLMVGTNYFSTDPYTSAFFCGGSVGGNAWLWDKDFAEMKRLGFTAVRTGIWLNRFRYLDQVSFKPDERLLRAIEAYLHMAARYGIQVIFTFFAFEPQSEMQQGPGQEGDRLGPGSNPYIDPVSIEYQKAYVTAIASRFRNVPFLSFDLINEPSFNNPKRLWKGNSPNNDPIELAAWQQWLRKKYVVLDSLANAWRVPVSELISFDKVPVPSFSDFQLARSNNARTLRAIDFNLFAQDAFSQWVQIMIQAIRSTGANQVIAVGQDEGGVADRVLNQFWAQTDVSYTSNHTWWRDDALLWGSVAAKTISKPNLIGETGIQPVWSMDGNWRWDEMKGLPLLERKYVLGFANANAGVLHWDWTKSDSYGLLRSDGSQRKWMDVLRGIASFANKAQSYTTEALQQDIALVLPQSLQLSVFLNLGLEAQQKSVRALYNYARASAFAIGEYQLKNMPRTTLIIVPAPWILSQQAWQTLMKHVKDGANLLISGRVDADEHWIPITDRLNEWNCNYSYEALTTRETILSWGEKKARLTYSGDKTTYLERGKIKYGETLSEVSLGKGRIFYSPLPLEFADQLDVIGEIYRYAIEKAGVKSIYETTCQDPGILICPTQLPNATLYVLTSESNSSDTIEFKDIRSGASFKVNLLPGRAALMLVGIDGKIIASYNASIM